MVRVVGIDYGFELLVGAGNAAVMAAVASGEVTPREAAEIARLVEIFVRTLEVHEFERRLLALGEPTSAEEK